MELMGCADLAVPADVMHHVVTVESSYNPYAIGVVGGRLQRQPKTLSEALATVRMLERRGYNFSLGLAQVNRYNLDKQGLTSYERAFDRCANLQAGSRILAECQRRAGDWGKAFSCYYSGNFTTGFRHGYVQKVYASMARGRHADVGAIALAGLGRVKRPESLDETAALATRPVRAAPVARAGRIEVLEAGATRAAAVPVLTATAMAIPDPPGVASEAPVTNPVAQSPGQAESRADSAFVF